MSKKKIKMKKEKEYYEPAKWIDDQRIVKLEKENKDLKEMLSECRKSLGICMNRLQEIKK